MSTIKANRYENTATTDGGIDINTSGLVGIGTASPSGLLAIHQAASSTSNYINITNNATGSSSWANGMLVGVNDAGDALCWQNENQPLRFGTNNNERLRIDSSGRLLVGTTTEGHADAANLTVADASDCGITIRSGTSNFGSIYFSDATSGNAEHAGYIDYSHSNNSLRIGTNESTRLIIDSSGNVGIGSSAPQRHLHIHEPTSATVGMMLTNSATGASNDSQGFQLKVGSDTHAEIAQMENSNLRFLTNASERMRIDSSGNVLIGTSSYNSTVKGVQFNQSGQAFIIAQDNPALQVNRLGGDGTVVSIRNDSSQVGTITVSGSATAYNTSSDYRLKENVVDISGAIDRVKQFKPKRFNFIREPGTTVDGFLAHETQTVVPEAVTGTKDEVDADGNAVMQGIDQSKIVPLLTAALQEAIAKIETLETKVAALEAG